MAVHNYLDDVTRGDNVAKERRQRSSIELAGCYLIFIIWLVVSNILSQATDWIQFISMIGWVLAVLAIVISYGFEESMQSYPWFWNNILVSDGRIILFAESFGLCGMIVSIALDPTLVIVNIMMGLFASLLMLLFAYNAKSNRNYKKL